LAANGVTGRGFAEYWDAAPLTLLSGFRLHVFPFQYCNGKPCPYFLHQASAWYRPGTTRSSFIVLRHGSTPAKAFGRPARFISAGPFRVFVYHYDVARRFAPLEVD
jgi:hypothetical protein